MSTLHTSGGVSQLPAHNLSIGSIPSTIAHCAPHTIIAHFKATLQRVTNAHQSNISMSAN